MEEQEQQEQQDKPKNVFEVMGQHVEITPEELAQAVARQEETNESRQADALQDISTSLHQLVRLLKPWAEREKRRNMLEQDPDYLEQLIKQVQLERNRAKKPKLRKRLK